MVKRIIQKYPTIPKQPEPSGWVERFDGAFVATSRLDRKDLRFLASEEEQAGNTEKADKLCALARTKPPPSPADARVDAMLLKVERRNMKRWKELQRRAAARKRARTRTPA